MKAPQDIILKPMITEQSVDNMQQSKYTFQVAKDANKIEIAQAAEALFHVEVVKVNTVNCTGKTKWLAALPARKQISRRQSSPSIRKPQRPARMARS